MQEAGVSFLTTWQSFSVLIGSAAATLTGLMFVVATLIAGVRVSSSSEAFATFNSPNVWHFCAALLVAAVLSAPWQALWHEPSRRVHIDIGVQHTWRENEKRELKVLLRENLDR
jgi:hypothetical protein